MPLRGVTQKEELAQATARITQFEGQLAAATETISKLETAKTEISAQLTNANTAIVDLNDKNAELKAALKMARDNATDALNQFQSASEKITKLEGEAKSADERAREIAARTGTLLPKKDPKAIETTVSGADVKTMSRSEFANLTHSARMAFSKAGGRLTNDE